MRRISTKLNISMLMLTVLILAFAGGFTIVNMSVEYRRDFEKTAKQVLEDPSLQNAQTPDEICAYLEPMLPLFSDSTDYYVLEGGNIIRSSQSGGLLQMSEQLSLMTGAKPDSRSKRVVDRAINVNGFTAYIIDSKQTLYQNIKSVSFLYLQALVFGILLTAIISYFISKRLTRSIKKLEEGAKRMSEGEFTLVSVSSRDEIGSLCDVFNDMGRQIQSDYDEFERVEKSRREFVANVSHELKTPLTVIKSYSETLVGAEVDRETQKQFLGVIGSEVDRMSNIVSQLLLLSRLESERPAQLRKTDLEELCREIAAGFAIQAERKNISLVISGSGEAVTDREKIKTVLTNLISNAVKYSKEHNNIEVEISDNNVTVTNYGIPISEKDLPHIFERFYRTDKARSRETGGTGLGLAIAKESAEAVGATLTAQSDESGKTTFRLEF